MRTHLVWKGEEMGRDRSAALKGVSCAVQNSATGRGDSRFVFGGLQAFNKPQALFRGTLDSLDNGIRIALRCTQSGQWWFSRVKFGGVALLSSPACVVGLLEVLARR